MKDQNEIPEDLVKAFHAHLDVCEQCRNNPFALCPTGLKLLETGTMSSCDALRLIDDWAIRES